jgi:hypothetical protein
LDVHPYKSSRENEKRISFFTVYILQILLSKVIKYQLSPLEYRAGNKEHLNPKTGGRSFGVRRLTDWCFAVLVAKRDKCLNEEMFNTLY